MRKCKECECDIPEARIKALPLTTQCVKCSTTGKKAGITVTMGEGDHTYNEIIIMEPEEYKKIQELERKIYGVRKDDIPFPGEEIIEEEDDKLDTIENNELPKPDEDLSLYDLLEEIEDDLSDIKEIQNFNNNEFKD